MNAVKLIVIAGMLFGANAFNTAEGADRRQGFNFGANFYLVEGDNNTSATQDIQETNNQFKTSTQGVSPYIGYSTGTFNLGVMASAESTKENSVETSLDGNTEIKRNIARSTSSVGIFMRFLFGKVFYLEGASSLYRDQVSVENEYRIYDGSSEAFTGTRDNYTLKSVGPGYHVAGGIEIPVSTGFYFTAGYQLRIVQLRELKGETEVGAKKSYNQRRTILFGIEHYTK